MHLKVRNVWEGHIILFGKQSSSECSFTCICGVSLFLAFSVVAWLRTENCISSSNWERSSAVEMGNGWESVSCSEQLQTKSQLLGKKPGARYFSGTWGILVEISQADYQEKQEGTKFYILWSHKMTTTHFLQLLRTPKIPQQVVCRKYCQNTSNFLKLGPWTGPFLHLQSMFSGDSHYVIEKWK